MAAIRAANAMMRRGVTAMKPSIALTEAVAATPRAIDSIFTKNSLQSPEFAKWGQSPFASVRHPQRIHFIKPMFLGVQSAALPRDARMVCTPRK